MNSETNLSLRIDSDAIHHETNINTDVLDFDELDVLLNDLEEQEIQLSEEEEAELIQLLNNEKSINDIGLLQGLGDAALKGVEDYLNSFIDTSEIFDDLKNPKRVSEQRLQKITPNLGSQTKTAEKRTVGDAKDSPYRKGSVQGTDKMSDQGRTRLKHYEEAYRQRLKTRDRQGSKKAENESGQISLAALKSYQFGPIVSCYTPNEYKQMYEQEPNKNKGVKDWVRDKNFEKFHSENYKKFGFDNAKDFESWIKKNELTIHETPDGMYLVPNDIHASTKHEGGASLMTQYINGEITKEQYDKISNDIKRTYLKHECKIRGKRAVKGASMAIVKTIVLSVSSIIVTETYFEFKDNTTTPFIDKVQRIINRCYKRIKRDIKKNILSSGAMSFGTELLNLINDFILKTAKNIFKIFRAMFGSIMRALKVIFSSNASWEDRLFETVKILSGGFVAAIGFSLNEIIDKLITTAIPPLAFAAPFIADVFAGLFASIMSALVLTMFDKYKSNVIKTKNKLLEESLRIDKIVQLGQLRLAISNERSVILTTSAIEAVRSSLSEMTIIEKTINAKKTDIDTKAKDNDRLLAQSSVNKETIEVLITELNSYEQ